MPDGVIPGGPDDPTGGAMQVPDDSTFETVEKPIWERLKYKDKLHQKTLARLIALRDMGREAIENKHDEWAEIDENMGMKVDLTRLAKKGDETTSSEKELPFERAFVVPVSFSVERVILAQIMSIYAGRDPMIQFDGNGPEDVAGAKLIEVVGAWHAAQSRLRLKLYSAIQGSIRYGFGPLHSYWNESMGWVKKPILEGPMAELLAPFMPDLLRPVRQWGLKHSYFEVESIDPYKMRVDPRRSMVDFQRGNFIGHERLESKLFFQSRQLEKEDGPYFNIKYLERAATERREKERTYQPEPSSQGREYGDTDSYPTEHLEVNLIPEEWELGESDRPEKWWFEWTSDAVIVRAHRSSYDHGDYNYAIGQAMPNLHTVLPYGHGELLNTYQRFSNWMGTSHFENVRRFINNASLIFENFIEVEDVLNPGPAGHIRATEAAQELVEAGVVSDPRVFYPQLQLTDVTSGHLNDITFMFDLVSRLTGVNDPAQGIHLPSKRTATEIDALVGAASQGTQNMAMLLDDQMMGPLADQMSSAIQQFTSDEKYYRIAGDLAGEIERRVGLGDMVQSTEGGLRAKIAPSDLWGDYDYIPYTGMDPTNPARSAQTMMEMLGVIGNFPQLMDPMAAMQMGEKEIADVKEWVLRIAENMKIKDIRRLFKPNPLLPPELQTMPDDQMMAAVQAGNMVGAQEAAAAGII